MRSCAPAPAGTDLAAATAWLRSLVEVLQSLGDAADASNLTFESTVVPGHDSDYGAAGADVHAKVSAARWGAQALGAPTTRRWARSSRNHIVMVESYDPVSGKLVSIEGNVSEGVRPDADGKAQRTDGKLKSSSESPTSTVVEVRNMKDEKELTRGPGADGVYRERGHRTIYAIGRPRST